MTHITLSGLVDKIADLATGKARVLIALAGPPASGKSTLAEDLAVRIGPTSAVLPMDGFHLDNPELEQMGLLHRKGAPQTFDGESFVALVEKLRGQADVPYPTFDRVADKTVANGGHISEETNVVLIEGNYLLLNTPPWEKLAGLFDLTVRLEVPRATLERRLIDRWVAHGLTQRDAHDRALGNDMKNVDFVAAHSFAPDVTLGTQG